MDKALALDAGGRGFDPSTATHFSCKKKCSVPLCYTPGIIELDRGRKKAMCSKPLVEACHFSVVHIVWCSEGPCEPSNENQFSDLDPEPLETEHRRFYIFFYFQFQVIHRVCKK